MAYILCSRPNVEKHVGWIKEIDNKATIIMYQLLLALHPDLSMNPYAYQYKKIEKQIEDIVVQWNAYESILNDLDDEISKEILMRMILYRLTYDVTLHEGIKTKYPHYFDEDVVTIGDNEMFVDCGGYNGDTLREFKRITNDRFEGYYLFEPDEQLINIAKDSAIGDGRVTFVNKGVWDMDTTLEFYSESSAGNGTMVMENQSDNVIKVPVCALGNIVDRATFIKMDVEGSELQALTGAKDLIQRCKPKMAICVYHKYEDYTVLFKYIKSLADYKIYLRAQYDNIDMELYYLCVPRGRKEFEQEQ